VLRSSAALHIPVSNIFMPMIAVQVVGLIFVFTTAVPARPAARAATPDHRNVRKNHPCAEQAGTAARFAFNILVTIVFSAP
jgi:CitMHS family citrate-Mg2+:H+ or citrate-Ca2+:H+ symporter